MTTDANRQLLDAIEAREHAMRDLKVAPERAQAEWTEAIIAAVLEEHPRTRKIPERTPDESADSFAGRVNRWSQKRLAGERRAFITDQVRVKHDARTRKLRDAYQDAGEVVRACALDVVLPATEDTRVVFTSHISAYSSQGMGASTYARFPALLNAEVLRRRGFRVEVCTRTWGDVMDKAQRPRDPYAFDVVTNAPPQVEHLLPHWRLDEATQNRIARQNGAVNYKVFNPYLTPYWDQKDPETRDSDSYARIRANEDAHMTQNAPGEDDGTTS